MLLIPPVLLKLGSTGYRFARYYSGSAPYVRKGPPHIALRVLAPGVVLTTLALFGTGVALLVGGPHDGPRDRRPRRRRPGAAHPPRRRPVILRNL
jgi:hypothetical protein